MPNPDGTHTRDEHIRAITARMQDHIANGLTPDEALTRASASWQEEIRAEGERKIQLVTDWLKGKRSA